MKVVRFMSTEEKDRYLSGEVLHNDNPHRDYKTTSVGFCFAELNPKRDADKWLMKLFFLTKTDWCVEFDTDRFFPPLNESKATYCSDNNFGKTQRFREWCTQSYSLKTHPYERIGKCPAFRELVMGEKIQWQTPTD